MEEIKDIQNLLNEVSSISKRYDDDAEKTGEKFNIFKILKMETAEVRTHSAFLAELLNPKGSHSQGDVFLKLFIAEVEKINSDQQLNESKSSFKFILDNFETGSASVTLEKYVNVKINEIDKKGFIDIVIESEGSSIFIENKIYARDQDKQLLKYHKSESRVSLFYLTLEQDKKPHDDSVGHLIEGTDYNCISYEKEIINWLEKCREEADKHSILESTIKQYIYLIKYLTNQTLNNKMENDLIELILSSKENLEAFLETNKLGDKVNDELLKRFEHPLKSYTDEKKLSHFSFEKEKKFFIFQNEWLKRNNLQFCYGYDKGFLYGFEIIEALKVFEDSKKHNEIKEFIKNKFKIVFRNVNEGSRFAWLYHNQNDNKWNSDYQLCAYNDKVPDSLVEKLDKMLIIAQEAEEFEKNALKEQNQ